MEHITIIFFSLQLVVFIVAIVAHFKNRRWAYSTRHLLIAMTLIAIAVATVAGLAR